LILRGGWVNPALPHGGYIKIKFDNKKLLTNKIGMSIKIIKFFEKFNQKYRILFGKQ